jgi:hypothetical protein
MTEVWSSARLAQEAGLSLEATRYHLQHGHVEGAFKLSGVWAIPEEAAYQWLAERDAEEEERLREE